MKQGSPLKYNLTESYLYIDQSGTLTEPNSYIYIKMKPRDAHGSYIIKIKS